MAMGSLERRQIEEVFSFLAVTKDGDIFHIRQLPCDSACKEKKSENFALNLQELEHLAFFKSNLIGEFNNSHQMAVLFLKHVIKYDSEKCFHLIYKGLPSRLYYLVRLLAWLPPELNIHLKCEFQPENNTNYLLRSMSKFVLDYNFDAPTYTYPRNYDSCHEKDCSLVLKDFKFPLTNSGIDVVIPTKNVSQQDLERCFKSFIKQLKGGDCVYIVDDNIQNFLDYRKLREIFPDTFILKGLQEGVASARNIGARAGKNSLVAFIDSDDFVLGGYLNVQRGFHIRNQHIGASCTWLKAFGSTDRVFPQWENFNPLSILNCLPAAGVLFWKRKALESLGFFDLEFKNGFEDFDLVARATANGIQIASFDWPLYMYQRGHVSLSQSWNHTEEKILRSKVNSNLINSCKHKIQEAFEIISDYGIASLISHPDWTFSQKESRIFYYINKSRNNKKIRGFWHLLPLKFRFALWRLLVQR